MTTPAPRALGRGVAQLIPQPGDISAAGRATASLAALRAVPVHAGVLEAAVALLEDLQDPARDTDDATVAAEAATVTLLRRALHPDTWPVRQPPAARTGSRQRTQRGFPL
ncbi:hypothetical protein ACFYWU_40600 [Streptomyces chrestomyceticus]|uniref:hypothetical protein n=1 Tax=Streptomyces chrestomyceticus TaxID=68185 RepID=UPI0036C68468